MLFFQNFKKWWPYAALVLALCLGYFFRPFSEKGEEGKEEYLDLLEKYRQDPTKYNQLFENIEQLNNGIDNQIWFYDQSIRKQDEIIDNLKKQNEYIQDKKNNIDSVLHSLDALERFNRISGYFDDK